MPQSELFENVAGGTGLSVLYRSAPPAGAAAPLPIDFDEGETAAVVLLFDDAFAGGVCRCQYCGTIQTVPSRLKTSGGGQSSGLMDHAGAAPAGRSSADVGSAVGSRKASSKSPVEVRSPSKSGASARSGAGLRGDSDNGGTKALYGRKPRDDVRYL